MEVKTATRRIKRRAEELPNAPPSSIITEELLAIGGEEEVLILMPEETVYHKNSKQGSKQKLSTIANFP